MTQRRFEAAGGLGIWVLLDVAQRSSCHDFAAMNPSAWPQINNVIRTLNCLLIVLDHDERIAFVPQRGERFEQARSEERRVGKECRARWWPCEKQKENT